MNRTWMPLYLQSYKHENHNIYLGTIRIVDMISQFKVKAAYVESPWRV